MEKARVEAAEYKQRLEQLNKERKSARVSKRVSRV